MSEADSVLFGRAELERHSPRWASASFAEASWQTYSSWAAPLWPWLTTPGWHDGWRSPVKEAHSALIPLTGRLRQLAEMFFECVRKPDRLSDDIRDDQVISLFGEGEHVLGLVGAIEALRAVRTSSVVASSAICGNMALRLLRWAPSSVSVMASVTIVSS
jgi:hypothetical protein